jgi:hypothetical protein
VATRLRTVEVQVSFAAPGDAEIAAAALRDAGIDSSSITLQHSVLPEPRAREARFLWRVLLIIVLWSIAGGIIGAPIGWLLAETIGPEGTAGLIVQLVTWIILGHLVAGMLAGYFVLADRTEREMPPDRPVSVLIVSGLPPPDAGRVRRLLRSHDPRDLCLQPSGTSSRSS